jgi:hypothetical protein
MVKVGVGWLMMLNMGRLRVRRLMLALALMVGSVLAVSARDERPAPFTLWPASPEASPEPFVKMAPPLPVEGKAWPALKTAEEDGSVKVSVDLAKTIAPVTPYHFGGNVSWWNHHDWLLREDIVEKARQSGIRFWRWPGGSSADNYFWHGDYKGYEKEASGKERANMNGKWAVSNDDFIAFCKATNSQAIVTANYGLARYGTVKEASELASSWIKEFKKKGFPVRYWEIGNENFGLWEEGTTIVGKPTLSGADYGKDFVEIAKAMRKTDKDIYIGAVAVELDNDQEWTGYRGWMKGLLPQVQSKADYLILHQYFMWPFDQSNNYTNPTPAVLFGNLTKLGEAVANVKTMTPKYVPDATVLPIALTEFNLVNASPKETIQLLNGLFTAEVLGEHIRRGYVCSNQWDWRNGLDQKLGGDHALLAVDDPSVPDGTPRPAYYAYVLYRMAFGDKLVESMSSDSQVKVYASRFKGGEAGVVVVNESDVPKRVELTMAGGTFKGQWQGWLLTGKDVHAKQVVWNGVAGPENGGGPFPVDPIPAYRGSFKPEGPLVVTVPPASASGIVVY